MINIYTEPKMRGQLYIQQSADPLCAGFPSCAPVVHITTVKPLL